MFQILLTQTHYDVFVVISSYTEKTAHGLSNVVEASALKWQKLKQMLNYSLLVARFECIT